MVRALVVLLLTAACEPTLHVKPLPELAAVAPPKPIAVPMLRLDAGESMTWDVHMQGFTVGRATLDVGEHEVHSHFATAGIASTLSRVRHDLTTRLDPFSARPSSAVDTLDVDGEQTLTETMFEPGGRVAAGKQALKIPGGNTGHTLHSALGVIRAWASPQSRSGYLYIVHAGELFRLDIQQPLTEVLQDRKTLRVECRVRGETPISMSIWLSDSPERVPLRIEVRAEGVRLTAELIDS
jgi:hypothetical protein